MEAADMPDGARMNLSRCAAIAFDAVAPVFDERFGTWASVAAQRRAVRAVLLESLPLGERVFEVGGGTGEDAVFLASHGYDVVLTDPSPAMVSVARSKLVPMGARAEVLAAEDLEEFASHHLSVGGTLFGGAYSNFAALNCVEDLRPVARGFARLLKPGAPALLVFFGVFCPGEMITELVRKRPRQALRRLQCGAVATRLAGHEFNIVYHRRAALRYAFEPWFALERRFGIGIAVPPSAAEPWISAHPRLVNAMEGLDRKLSRVLAVMGDHVLYQFRRTTVRSTME